MGEGLIQILLRVLLRVYGTNVVLLGTRFVGLG